MLRAPYAAAGAIACSEGMATLAALLRARAADEPDRPPAERRLEREWGEAFWQRRQRRFTAMDPQAFNALVLELIDQAPLAARLGEIRCPTTVIVGAEDRGFLRPAGELAAHIPGARLVTIADAAHSPQIENPAAWLAAVRAHLDWARQSPGG
jgi:2-succinyl-6-hydroxy-2,4-cyclohexadiene-1-carboxylate synthase